MHLTVSYEIDVFNVIFCNFSGSETVERDFTYVTDVVEGITAAMSYRPRRCGEVFNLGRGQPEPLTSLVPLLERILGIKAVVVSGLCGWM